MMAEPIKFVSLGDSIATGTLTPFSNTASYVYYLQRELRARGCRPQTRNLATDGDGTRELHWKLQHADRLRGAVEAADCITLSIGGNDLLKASAVPGFYRINPRVAEQGAGEFLHNWPRIVDKIRGLNPEAALVVLSVYNPYNETRHLPRSCAHDRNLCELTDRFLAQINQCIAEYAEHHYRIADVYAAFKEFAAGRMHQVACLYPDSVLRNPHPTPRGQRIIADLILEQLPLPDRAGPSPR